MLRHIIVTLLALGIGIGGYMGYLAFTARDTPKNPYSLEPLPSEKTYADIQADAKNQAQSDVDIYNHAGETADISICEAIQASSEKVRCRDMVSETLALRDKKKESCDALSDIPQRTRCRDTIIYALASSGTTRSMCDELTDETLMTECRNMIDTKLYAAALASGKIDDAFCATLWWELGATCQSRILRSNDQDTYKNALATKDINLCTRLTDSTLKSQCRDILILEIALREKNPDYCENIANREKSDFCKKSLSAQNEATLYQAIIVSNDVSRCGELTTVSYTQQCHDVLTIARVRRDQDATLCQSLYNTGMIANCELLAAKK